MAQLLDRRTQTEEPVSGVRPLSEREVAVQRRTMLVATALPALGFVAAVWTFWGHGFSPTDAAIFGAFYLFTGLGVTVGFHRLFTHKSFDASRWLAGTLAVAGSMSIQGSLIKWVADHRRHHAFSDQVGDPHSPHLDEGPGVLGVLKGLWHAHMGWFFAPERTDQKRWAPDMLKDPMMVRIDRAFPLIALASFALPALLGYLLTGTFAGALTAFLWGSLTRVFLLHHVTWSINSICHFYGRRPFDSHDFSANNWLLSLISFGESWHNNHHAFPTSARHGIGRGQVDLSAGLISLFTKLGWARNLHLPSPKQMASKALTSFHARGVEVEAKAR